MKLKFVLFICCAFILANGIDAFFGFGFRPRAPVSIQSVPMQRMVIPPFRGGSLMRIPSPIINRAGPSSPNTAIYSNQAIMRNSGSSLSRSSSGASQPLIMQRGSSPSLIEASRMPASPSSPSLSGGGASMSRAASMPAIPPSAPASNPPAGRFAVLRASINNNFGKYMPSRKTVGVVAGGGAVGAVGGYALSKSSSKDERKSEEEAEKPDHNFVTVNDVLEYIRIHSYTSN